MLLNRRLLFLKLFHFSIILTSGLFVLLITQTISPDFFEYGVIYEKLISEESLTDALINLRFEPFFTLIFYYLSKILAFTPTFLLIAFTVLLAKYIIFQKFYKYPLVAWLFYVIIFLPHLEASQLRTSIAVTFLIYVISTPKPKKYYFFEAIGAASFHLLGFIIIFNRFIRNIIIGFLFISLGLLAFKLLIAILTSYIPFLLNYIQNDNNLDPPSLINSNVVIQAVVSACCMISWRNLNYPQKKGAFLIIIGLIIYLILFSFPGISQRIREISLLGIFPLIFYNRLSLKLPVLIIYLLVSVLFIYNFYFLVLRFFNY